MRTSTHILHNWGWALILAACVSCGGKEAARTWATTVEAAEDGAQALAAGDLALAQAAYAKASEATDPAAKLEALTGLYRSHLKGGQTEPAKAAVQRLIAETGAAATPEVLSRLADEAVLERNADLADAVVVMALAAHPQAKESFAKAVQAVEMLRTQGEGADLSSLGYAGD